MRNFLGAIITAIGAFLFSLGYIVMDDGGKAMFVEKFASAIYDVIKDDLPEFAKNTGKDGEKK